jgi:hypothetical protein
MQELMVGMENQITAVSEAEEKEIKALPGYKENNAENLEDRVLVTFEQLYLWWMGYVKGNIFSVKESKLLPVDVQMFDLLGENELGEVDDVLEKIIRQRVYKRQLEERLKTAADELAALEQISQTMEQQQVQPHVIYDSAKNVFSVSTKMFNNILQSQSYCEQQGIGDKNAGQEV